MALDIADTLAIQDLMNRYCYNADYNPPARMRDLFTADAVWEVPAMNLRFEGIDAIVGFFTQSRESGAGARHVISNVVVEGDGDRASAQAYLQVIMVTPEQNTIVTLGRYIDELVRTPDGWRFAQRSIVIG